MHQGLFDTINPVIAVEPITGNGAKTTPIIDMKGWNGCAFVYTGGANSGGTTTPIVISQSDSSSFAASTVIASGTSTPGTAANSFSIADVWRPTGRYLRATATPAGTVAMSVMAYQYSRTGLLPANGTAGAASTGGSATTYTRLQVN
jgi:hypothetical protein